MSNADNSLELALRVLTDISHHRHPSPSDTEKLKSLVQKPDAPIDEIAQDVIMEALRRRRKERAPVLWALRDETSGDDPGNTPLPTC